MLIDLPNINLIAFLTRQLCLRNNLDLDLLTIFITILFLFLRAFCPYAIQFQAFIY